MEGPLGFIIRLGGICGLVIAANARVKTSPPSVENFELLKYKVNSKQSASFHDSIDTFDG